MTQRYQKQGIKRLDPLVEGEIGSLNIKRVRMETIRRVRKLAAERSWTMEYAIDRALSVGLTEYEQEAQ